MLKKLAIGLLLLLALAPLPAWAQAWSVQVDTITGFDMRIGNQGQFQTIKSEDHGGMAIAVGTPYHLGFGYDAYQGTFPFGDDGGGGSKSVSLNVNFVNVFVDIPVPILTFSLGTGWGTATFDPDSSTKVNGGTVSKNSLSPPNLWQFYAQVGLPVWGGFEVHMSYREFRGRFKSTEDRTTAGVTTHDTLSFSVEGQVSTLGIRYTF